MPSPLSVIRKSLVCHTRTTVRDSPVSGFVYTRVERNRSAKYGKAPSARSLTEKYPSTSPCNGTSTNPPQNDPLGSSGSGSRTS